MKSNFEERLEKLCGAEGLKAAKQLLKQNCLCGAWHDEAGNIHGVFRQECGRTECMVVPGDDAVSECSRCENTSFPCCSHAVALMMYSGRFHRPEITEEAPFYSRGLRRDPISSLMDLSGKENTAELFIDSLHEPPHLPSRWEQAAFKCKIRCQGREYLGNLNNLRQIFFEKFLSATVRWEGFSLQDRQIIRFLALNGEAENSNIVLPAELAAELFHCLIGFNRFMRDNRAVIFRRENAEPVLLVNGSKCFPGIRIANAIIPVNKAQIITGRSGCWVGKDGEYYFVPAGCEITYLRSFFSSPVLTESAESIEEYKKKFPFPVIKVKAAELPLLTPRLFLDGSIDPEEGLLLETGFLYRSDSGKGVLCVPETGVVNGSFRRNREVELRLLDRLAMFGFESREGQLVLRDLEHIGTFFTNFLPQLLSEKMAPVLGAGLLRGVGADFALPAEISCAAAGNNETALKLRIKLSAGGEILEWDQCCNTALKHGRFLLGSGGKLVELPEKLGVFLRASEAMFSNMDRDGMIFELPFANIPYYSELCRDLPGALIPEVTAGASRGGIRLAGAGFEFKGALRSYQEQGVDFMRYMAERNFNSLLADEMGLGKTVQLLALLSSCMGEKSLPSLIVCPASLVTNWERESARFVPGFKVGVPGAAKRKEFWEHAREYNLIIISYTVARLDLEHIRRCKFSFLVLDEAQHIKNPGSTNAKSCKSIRAEHRIVLTGTPLENCSADLWSIFDFLQPGMLGTLPTFKRRYANVAFDEEMQQDLKMRISPFILRRTKAEVAKDLPEREEHIIYCDFSPEQQKLYDAVLAEGRAELGKIKDSDAGAGAAIFSILLRLRQVCCHPALLPDGRGEGIPSVKSDLFMELVQQNIDSGHKMLGFSQFTSLLALLKENLQQAAIPFEYLDGATVDRQKHVDNFNNDPALPLFLLSLKAGGTGLNLVSADTVLIYDPWWNPAAELQAADRAHRIGQTKAVNICKLVVRNSIEEKIIALQGRKKAVFDALISDSVPEKLSAAELRAILTEE